MEDGYIHFNENKLYFEDSNGQKTLLVDTEKALKSFKELSLFRKAFLKIKWTFRRRFKMEIILLIIVYIIALWIIPIFQAKKDIVLYFCLVGIFHGIATLFIGMGLIVNYVMNAF